jgi:flavin-dependent dehydrogenase
MANGNHHSDTETDLIVLGGGPAGAAAAITAAQRGLRVVVVEGERFPRSRAGEALHPGVEVLFRQLGVAEQIDSAGFLRHCSITVAAANSTRQNFFGADLSGMWRGYQAWRPQLDSILLERARDAGARVLQPCRALEVLNHGGEISGIRTSSGDLRAPFAIDATGSRRWLARRLGLTSYFLSPRLTCRYGYFQSAASEPDVPVFTETLGGWMWRARVRPQVSQWLALDLRPNVAVPAPPEGLTWCGRILGADVTWRLEPECAGSGYLLCGDAAAVLDPACARGVLRGLMTGIMAAHVVSEMRTGALTEAHAIAGYRRWLTDWIAADALELARRYQDIPAAPAWLASVSSKCESLVSRVM